MNLVVYIFGKVYINMYSFAAKLSVKMAIMAETCRRELWNKNIFLCVSIARNLIYWNIFILLLCFDC
jgi:hypothetical protein